MIALLVVSLLAQMEEADAGAVLPSAEPEVVAVVDAGVVVVETPNTGLSGLTWSPRIDVFGEYGIRRVTGVGTFNEFDVPRVHAGAEAEWNGVRGRVLIEGARSTTGGALIGVAGDSVVIRIREAWAGYRWRFLEARLGMIAMPLTTELEYAFAFRALTPDGLELYRFAPPADLGFTLRAELPRGYGWVALTASNGEGYTLRELNNGKNLEASALVRPLAAFTKSLGILASARFGSTGVSQSTSNRFGGGVLWTQKNFGAGATAFYAQGLRDDGGLRALLLQGWVRGALFDRLLLAARVHRFQRDLAATGDDSLTQVLGAVGVRIFSALEVYVCVDKVWASPLAFAAVPGSDVLTGRLVARLVFPGFSPLDFPEAQ